MFTATAAHHALAEDEDDKITTWAIIPPPIHIFLVAGVTPPNPIFRCTSPRTTLKFIFSGFREDLTASGRFLGPTLREGGREGMTR
jgi:hypothetical protein